MFDSKRVCSLLLLALLPCSITVQAQRLEEVIVTAQKRSQSLQNVPISVAAISGAELAALNKTQVSDISRLVPGFTFSEGTSDADRSVLVRGVGTNSFSRSVDQSVGTVIDGVVSSSLAGSVLDFSDVERIEVLRGPQGMLFGKNASAGLLNITTRNPTEDLQSGFGVRYGSENLLNLNGYVSGPLVDNHVLGRLSIYRNTSDPILENEYPGGENFNNRNEWGGRAKLKWLVNENFDAQLNYTHLDRDHVCCVAVLRVVTPGSVVDREGGEVGSHSDTVLDNNSSAGSTRADIYSLELNYALGDYTLTSITSSSREEIYGSARADLYTRTALPQNDSFEDYQQVTQELRITSPADRTVSYVAGLYYYEKKIDRRFERYIDLYGIDFAPTPDSGALSVINETDTSNRSMAAFGQMTWNASERSRLSLGLRYNDDRLTHDQTVSNYPGTLPEAPPGTISAKTDDQAWSWRVIGEIDIASDAMLYASVARGYKGPGSNSLPSGPSSGDVFVKPEIPTNYELGVKSQWFDNRLRANATAYYTVFEDFQASAQVADSFPPLFFLTNAGELETRGVEIELSAQPTAQLTLQGSLAYTQAKFSDWQGAPCYGGQSVAEGCTNGEQDLSGADLPNSPDWAFNLGADYRIPLASKPFHGFINGNYFWRDEVQFDTTNNPLHVGDAYGTLDVYTGIAANSGRYTVQFFVENLFNQFYVAGIGGQDVVGVEAAHVLSYTYQRRYGVSLQMDF